MPFRSSPLKLSRYVSAILVFCLPFLLYVYTLSPTISVGDSPELTASAFTLGIAHPPGYPLYILLGKGMSLIPTGDHVAYKINFLSTILGGLSALFIYLAILEAIGLLRTGAGRGLYPQGHKPLFTDEAQRSSGIKTVPGHSIPALLGSLIFAVSPIFWSQAVVSEVYTLNAAFFTALLWLGLRWMKIRWSGVSGQGSGVNNAKLITHNSKLLYLISFLWGISLGNHHTMIAFGPIFFMFAVVYWFVGARRCLALGGSPTRPYSLITFFFLLGLSVYLYLPIRSGQNPFMDWGDTERLSGFLEVILRKQFGLGSRDYSLERAMAQAGYYLTMLREQFTLPGLILGGIGLSFFIRRDFPASLFTMTLFLTYGIITTLFLNPAYIDLNAIDVMVIPSFAVFSIWIGVGLLFVYKGIAAIFTKGLTIQKERNIIIGTTLISLLIPAAVLYINLYKNNQRENTFAYDYAGDIFNSIEPNGVLFADTDLSIFPLWYMQYVEGKRRDVAVLNVDMLMLPWFKRQLKEKYPAVEIRVPDVMRHSKGGRFKPLSMEAIVSYKVSQVEEMLNGLIDKHPVYLSYDFGVPFKEFGERKDIHAIQKGITFRVSKEEASEEVISDSPALKGILKAIESRDEEVLFISRGYIPAMETAASRELASGHKDNAVKWMEAILTVNPYNASSLNSLAFLYAEDGKSLLRAEQMVKRALSIDPKGRGRYLKTLGYVYLKGGKYLMARETFTKVLEMEPASEWTRQRLEEASSKTSP